MDRPYSDPSASQAVISDQPSTATPTLAVAATAPLLGASLAELTEWVKQQQQPAYRGQQLHQWIYQKGVRSLEEISVIPKQWRSTVAEVPIGRSTLHYRSAAPDGT